MNDLCKPASRQPKSAQRDWENYHVQLILFTCMDPIIIKLYIWYKIIGGLEITNTDIQDDY